MATIPATVTILDLATGTLLTSALLEAQQTAAGVATTIAVTPAQIASAAFSAGFVVPVSGGGSGTSTLTAFGLLYGKGTTSPLGITAAGTTAWPLVGNGTAVAPSFQILPVSGGGIGTTALASHGVALGNGSSALGVALPTTAGWPLVSNNATSDPTFQQLDITVAVTGVLDVPHGGTGTSILTAFGVLYGNGSSIVGITAAGATALPLVSRGPLASAAFTTLTVPGGGTGTTTLIANRVLIGNGTNTIASSNIATTGFPLVGNGTSAAPGFAILGVPGGGIGTGTTTPFALLAGGTNATSQVQSIATTGASGLVLISQGSAALPIFASAGAGTVTSLTSGTGVLLVPGTITTVGSVQLSTSWITPPTTQLLTTGTVYTATSTTVRWIEAFYVGGGGGGAGATGTSTVSGSVGGTTTFNGVTAGPGLGAVGTTTLQAAGAGGVGGAGGTGTATRRGRGGPGSGTGQPAADVANFASGAGGNSYFAGGGVGTTIVGAGTNADAFSGAGGGGARTSGTNIVAGGGGGAGEYVYLLLAPSLVTYSYAIGAGGAGGSATNSGGNGGSASILVIEHYGS